MDMEYVWYVLASILAGVGTGFAGLSAATVMVPILIVLCPSFANETGAYQATAIALASDILGSAVTTSVYMKNKNIDLKRGRIMLICILSMCIVGSFAAWLAGNVVLGSFTLFLTFFIGIRFLVSPETERKNTADKGEKLGIMEVFISLFFGLTIGFGTGFVGTGGGMMMLVVFTVFLGMNLKTAVGTSTFIMTFTALFAFIAHAIIHPAIILERWDVLVICIVFATVSSLVSARYANRFPNRIIGLVTGLVLTLLGGVMLILNYWDILSEYAIVIGVLECFKSYLKFLIPAVMLLIIVKLFSKVPREVFRKALHIVAFMSSIVIVYVSDSWQVASATLFSFAIIVYPILHVLENWRGYGNFFIQRKKGEIKKSLLLLFISDAVLVAIFWGICGLQYIVVVGILMWGVGDACAALVGKKIGNHHINLPLADHRKTWEGSIAMVIASIIVGLAMMLLISDVPWYMSLLVVSITSICGAYMELITHNGDDTITVPAINCIVLLLLHFLVL